MSDRTSQHPSFTGRAEVRNGKLYPEVRLPGEQGTVFLHPTFLVETGVDESVLNVGPLYVEVDVALDVGSV